MNRITRYQVSREVPSINLNSLVNRPFWKSLNIMLFNIPHAIGGGHVEVYSAFDVGLTEEVVVILTSEVVATESRERVVAVVTKELGYHVL